MSKNVSIVCGVLLILVLVVGGYLLFGRTKGETIPKLAKVTGVVSLNDEPLPDVKVMFLPDPDAKVFGGPAFGMTDEKGHFELFYRDNKDHPGTVIGKNRVLLTDIMAIRTSRDKNPVLRRFATKYTVAATTDLSFDVKDLEQHFKVEVEPPE